MTFEAAILAGGKSRRMGTDKALLTIEGETLLARTVRLLRESGYTRLAVVGRAAGLAQRDAVFLPDDFPGEGPLAALATALARAEDTLLVVPCDLPLLSMEALVWLGAQETGAFGVVATTPDGKHQPLFARYTPALLPVLQQSLAAGERSFKPLLTAGLLRFVAVPPELAPHLESANDPASWQRLTSPSPSSCP